MTHFLVISLKVSSTCWVFIQNPSKIVDIQYSGTCFLWMQQKISSVRRNTSSKYVFSVFSGKSTGLEPGRSVTPRPYIPGPGGPEPNSFNPRGLGTPPSSLLRGLWRPACPRPLLSSTTPRGGSAPISSSMAPSHGNGGTWGDPHRGKLGYALQNGPRCGRYVSYVLPTRASGKLWLEPRQYKNDSIQSKIIPTLKLPRFFTAYMVREKSEAISK